MYRIVRCPIQGAGRLACPEEADVPVTHETVFPPAGIDRNFPIFSTAEVADVQENRSPSETPRDLEIFLSLDFIYFFPKLHFMLVV